MKVLVIQNRMGIGDMVIFLPYIEAISKHYSVPVSLLVKENTKCSEYLSDNPCIDNIIILDRDDKRKSGKHYGLKGIFNLALHFEKVDDHDHGHDHDHESNDETEEKIVGRLRVNPN